MAPMTPTQEAWRDRFESAIKLLAPGLDLVLAAGERLSRTLGPDDDWDPPVRPRDRRARVAPGADRPEG
jgi:hypothetical protein